MTKLPVISADKMEKVILSLGFKKIRQKGSHIFYHHHDGRTTTIPHHKGKVLSRPLIREILREIEISIDSFIKLL
ncbi:type II toxin-antitoxin system HicA family toxin [bacterium]|nr:type II toxin-antitoxin system HicA family toxin [FCB group bacterium]MBL7190072.1 type II toxin-antitoxin system HicA family toxin [bacterium]